MNLQSLPGGALVVGIQTPAGTIVKLEAKDVNGKVDSVSLAGQDGSKKYYSIPSALLDDISVTNVKEINLVLDGSLPIPKNGEMKVDFGFYPFVPSVEPNPALNIADVTSLTPYLTGGFTDSRAVQTLTYLSETSVQSVYQLNMGFAGIFHIFDDPATPFLESANLQILPNGALVIGVQAPAGTIVKLEAKDASGTDFVYLTGQDGGEKFYSIPASAFDDVNTAAIKEINVVLEGSLPGQPQQGTMTLDFGKYPFTPSVAPDPSVDISDVTFIPNFGAGVFSMGKVEVQLTLLSPLTAQFDFDFTPGDGGKINKVLGVANPGGPIQPSHVQKLNGSVVITPPPAFAGMFHLYDDSETPGTVETINLQTIGSGKLVLGIQGPAETTVKLEAKDAAGASDFVYLVGQDGNPKYYSVPYALFDSIDPAKVKEINLVLESQQPDQPKEGSLLVDFGLYQ